MVELKVTGMTCNGCANSVKRAINRLDPNATVEVHLESGLVRIEGTVLAEQVKESIAKAGYGVSSVDP
jgi:copper chaperone